MAALAPTVLGELAVFGHMFAHFFEVFEDPNAMAAISRLAWLEDPHRV